jgi:2-keto-4-pentenoate hydratase
MSNVIHPLQDAADAVDDALSVQLGLKGIWEAAGFEVGGWKVGFTTGDNRKKFPENFRPFGFVLAHRVLNSGAEVAHSGVRAPQIEPELYLKLGEPLSGEVSVEQARDAVAEIGPGFEVNERRYVANGTPLPVRVAVGLMNWGMIVGPGIEPPDWDLRTTEVTVSRDGEPEATTVMPSGGYDDPFVSLTRLCRRLDRFGIGLQAGDHILTGAFSHHEVAANQKWTASFSGIGEVEINFTE